MKQDSFGRGIKQYEDGDGMGDILGWGFGYGDGDGYGYSDEWGYGNGRGSGWGDDNRCSGHGWGYGDGVGSIKNDGGIKG